VSLRSLAVALVLALAASPVARANPEVPPLPPMPEVEAVCAGTQASFPFVSVEVGKCGDVVVVTSCGTLCWVVCVDGFDQRCVTIEGEPSCERGLLDMCYAGEYVCVLGLCVPYRPDAGDDEVCWGDACVPRPTGSGLAWCLEEWFCVKPDERGVPRFRPGPKLT